jgi:hypothetical protein
MHCECIHSFAKMLHRHPALVGRQLTIRSSGQSNRFAIGAAA